ncbi:hypothetical protein OE88DRAFT_125111 [Heliocybe sulcata]|uniref:Uncharacterized protein n=1 Tax=Heliocybe sulcata TaxID=5364 RepID=A0A5C3NKG0_9AGAM|nr:hypothetical protein OE88DRAFT_125111 [Heliocybe sulcata]
MLSQHPPPCSLFYILVFSHSSIHRVLLFRACYIYALHHFYRLYPHLPVASVVFLRYSFTLFPPFFFSTFRLTTYFFQHFLRRITIGSYVSPPFYFLSILVYSVTFLFVVVVPAQEPDFAFFASRFGCCASVGYSNKYILYIAFLDRVCRTL